MGIIRAIPTLLAIPLILSMVILVISTAINPTPDKIEKAGEILAEAATPWWIPVFEVLATILGGLVAVGFLYFIFSKKLM